MINFIENNIAVILGFIGSIVAYFVGQRSREIKTEIDEEILQNKKIENVSDTLELYEKLHQNLKEKLEEANKAYEILHDAYLKTVDLLKNCKEERERLKKEIAEFQLNIKTCEFDNCKMK
jgi:SMC interacting uncharacterized protein involved in chromosome segregation